MPTHICSFTENLKIKIVMAKTEKSIIAFETVKVKTIGKLLPHPFRK